MNQPTPRPVGVIPTVYRGMRFRSRLEARWAVFFDAARIRWEYEPEAFSDGITGYLPDFWLPTQGVYWEVKPTAEYDDDKIRLAVRATGKPVFVAFGQVGCVTYGEDCDCAVGDPESSHMLAPDGWDLGYYWCECPFCGYLGLKFEGRAARLPCPCMTYRSAVDDKTYNQHSKRLHAAYRAAQTHRFWDPR